MSIWRMLLTSLSRIKDFKRVKKDRDERTEHSYKIFDAKLRCSTRLIQLKIRKNVIYFVITDWKFQANKSDMWWKNRAFVQDIRQEYSKDATEIWKSAMKNSLWEFKWKFSWKLDRSLNSSSTILFVVYYMKNSVLSYHQKSIASLLTRYIDVCLIIFFNSLSFRQFVF